MHSYKDLRSAAVTLTIQILSIIFSILLALSLNDWRESRNNQQLVLTTLKNFRTELGNNKKAIEAALMDQKEFMKSMQNQTLAQPDRKKAKTIALPEINMPDVLTTAWETALVTKAMVHMDYDLIVGLSELYHQQKWLISLEDKVFQAILSPSSYEKKNDENLVRSLYISLKNIMEVERKLLSLYDTAIQRLDSLMRDH